MPTSQAFLDWQAAETLAAAAAAEFHASIDSGRTPSADEVAQLERLRCDAREKLHRMVEEMKAGTT